MYALVLKKNDKLFTIAHTNRNSSCKMTAYDSINIVKTLNTYFVFIANTRVFDVWWKINVH